MSETSVEHEINKPRAWYTDLSSYYLGVERLLFTATGILIVAYVCFSVMPDMVRRSIAFFVLTIAIIKLQPLANFFAGGKRVKMTSQDVQIIESIRKANISEKKKRALIRRYFPEPSSRNAVAMAVLCWTLMLQLFLVYGLAEFLAGLKWIQSLTEIIPTHIFYEYQSSRTAADIPALKVFKFIDLLTIPAKLVAVCILLTPFLKKRNVFPIVPSAIFEDTTISTPSKVRKALWGGIATLVIVFVVVAASFGIINSGYLEPDVFNSDNNALRSKLTFSVWKESAGTSLLLAFMLCLLIRLIADWLYVIKNLLIKKGVLNE